MYPVQSFHCDHIILTIANKHARASNITIGMGFCERSTNKIKHKSGKPAIIWTHRFDVWQRWQHFILACPNCEFHKTDRLRRKHGSRFFLHSFHKEILIKEGKNSQQHFDRQQAHIHHFFKNTWQFIFVGIELASTKKCRTNNGQNQNCHLITPNWKHVILPKPPTNLTLKYRHDDRHKCTVSWLNKKHIIICEHKKPNYMYRHCCGME